MRKPDSKPTKPGRRASRAAKPGLPRAVAQEEQPEPPEAPTAVLDIKAHYLALAGMSADYYWETDAEHRIAFTDVFSKHGHTFLTGRGDGKCRWELPHHSPDEAGWAAHRAALAAREPIRGFEFSRLGADGGWRYFSINGDPLFDATGTFTGYCGLGQDITARREAEDALRKSEERFRIMAEMSSDYFWATDAEHRISYTNLFSKNAHIFPKGMSRGMRRWELSDLAPGAADWDAHRAVLDARQPVRDFEFSRRGADGGWRFVSISGDPMFDVSGAFSGYQGVGRDITARKRVEEALRLSEARFRKLTEISSDFYWETDAEHRFTKHSAAAKGAIVRAFRDGAQLGMRRWEMPYLAPGAKAWEAHRRRLDAHLPFRDFEISHLGADGAAHQILISGDPLFDASGAFAGYQGIGRDISERRRAEKTLRESEQRYRSLFENAGDGIMILTRAGGIVSANAAFASMHGYSVQEVLNLELKQLLAPETFRLAPQRWDQIYAGELTSIEVEHRHRDGHLFPVEILASLIPSGDDILMQYYYRDVTERRRAEQTLRESEERYRSLFENAGDGILIIARDGAIVAANESFARMHGYSVREVMNLRVKDLLAPETRRSTRERWLRVLDGESMNTEVEHRHKDGHLFPVELTASLASSSEDSNLQLLYRDVTERRRQEAALLAAKQEAERANRAKTRFLAAASHDLRQPAQAINLFLDALLHTGLSEEQREITRYLGMSVSGLREMLGALLDISRLDAGVVSVALAPLRAENLLRQLEPEFALLAREKALRLRLRARAGLWLLADAGLLLRALRNVVGNALKYTRQGGILIGARRRGERVLIQVWDSGIGIAPEHIGQIYDEYFQVGNQARDRTQGLGLGLSIVARSVKLLGGEIGCSSRPGKGTVFEISLPLAAAPADGAREAPEQAGALDLSRFAGRRVVLVEDDLLVAKGIEQALAALGARVAAFGNAEEALASAASAAADFYISDFHLPGSLNGIELLDAIQRRSSAPIKAVLMTGETASGQLKLSAEAGWKVLFKPVELPALLAAL